MREVSVSRFVRATPTEVERALTPANVVEYEGSFRVRGVRRVGNATLVTAGASGLELTLRFESVEGGLQYEQEGTDGPFDYMATRLTVAAENEGSRVRAESTVSLGVPPAFLTDRVAAWKRKGELKRALDALAADVE